MRKTPIKRKKPMLRKPTPDREAVLLFDLHGDFAKFKKGDIVKVRRFGDTWSVERVPWKKPGVTLTNVLAMVPRRCFKFITPLTKPRKPLPRQSPKRAARNAEYAAAVKRWRAGHDGRCEMAFIIVNGVVRPLPRRNVSRDHLFRCPRAAERTPHHMALRGPNLCRVETFLGLCKRCHTWTHSHAREARRLGYLIDPSKT